MSALEEREFDARMKDNLGRNYPALLAHGMLGQTGFRLLHAPTFLPAYLFLLSGSKFVVGGALALQHLGAALSAILGATLIEHRRHVLPVLFAVGGLMRLQVLGIALAGLILPGIWPLFAIALFLFLFGLSNGMQGVAFNYLMSKLVPLEIRGRLTALRNVLAGVISAAIAFIGGTYFIDNDVLGNGYAATFLIAFLLTMAGMATLLFVREPVPPVVRVQTSVMTRLKDVPGLLAEDPTYTKFVIAKSLAALGTAAVPFYILYAGETLNITGQLLALLTVAFTLVQTFANLVWGLLADRFGNRLVFVTAVSLWALAALALVFGPKSLPFLMLIFGSIGAGLGGFQLSSINMVLEFGQREDLPMRIAISNAANSAMFAIGPLAGGLLASGVSYLAVFALAILAKTGAIAVLLLLVDDPRHRSAIGS